jgi:hypothetical protein
MRLFEEKKLSAKRLIRLAFRAEAAFFWTLAGGGRCPRLISRPQIYNGGLTSCVLTDGDNVQLSKARSGDLLLCASRKAAVAGAGDIAQGALTALSTNSHARIAASVPSARSGNVKVERVHPLAGFVTIYFPK